MESAGNQRVQAISRLLYRTGHTAKSWIMGKPTKKSVVLTTVQDAGFSAGVKKRGAWMYPGGVITRHPELTINGKEYYDPKELPNKLPRRKIESNFFVTINTNRVISEHPGVAEQAKQALRKMMDHLLREDVLCGLIMFGPKDSTYTDDRYADIIDKIEVMEMSVEVGEKLNRLHSHFWLVIHHYSQVQLSKPLMQQTAKEVYNAAAPATMQINGKPYVHVELLPQSQFSQIIKQYIHKGMVKGG